MHSSNSVYQHTFFATAPRDTAILCTVNCKGLFFIKNAIFSTLLLSQGIQRFYAQSHEILIKVSSSLQRQAIQPFCAHLATNVCTDDPKALSPKRLAPLLTHLVPRGIEQAQCPAPVRIQRFCAHLLHFQKSFKSNFLKTRGGVFYSKKVILFQFPSIFLLHKRSSHR